MAQNTTDRLLARKLDLTTRDGLLDGLTIIADALRKSQIDTSQARTFTEMIKQAASIIDANEKNDRDSRPSGRKDVEVLPGGSNASLIGSDGPMSVYKGRRRPDNVFSDVAVKQ